MLEVGVRIRSTAVDVRAWLRDLGRIGLRRGLRSCSAQLVEQRKRGEISRSAPDRRASARGHHGPQRARGKCAGAPGAAGARRNRVSSHRPRRRCHLSRAGPDRRLSRSSICANGSATWSPMCARIEQVLIDTLADFGSSRTGSQGATGVWTEARQNRRHRRPYQPLGHFPWLRAECRYGFELFPVHRALRAYQAGDVDAGRWDRTRGSRGEVVRALDTDISDVYSTDNMEKL